MLRFGAKLSFLQLSFTTRQYQILGIYFSYSIVQTTIVEVRSRLDPQMCYGESKEKDRQNIAE